MNIKTYQNAAEAIDKQLDLQKQIIEAVGTRDDLIQSIIASKEKVADQAFRILIMGQFSSGKSSMINAFLGEPILPTKVMPATALITEIKYAKEKRVLVYPAPGKWEGGEEPFDVPIDKIREYCLIDHKQGAANYKEGNVIESPFRKMEVFWPLDMLKDGVEVVDSPGLNDPNSHDTITLEYLPTADAIIYCMNGTAPYSKVDVDTLGDINLRGYNTPIFVITRFDDIKTGSPEDVEEAIDTINRNLKKNTRLMQPEYVDKLGGNGVFFVSSLQAIKAKRDHDREALLESGYLKMEKYLEEFLVKCKGDEKLSAIAAQMEIIVREASQTITEHLNTVDLPLAEFEARISSVKEKMELAKKKAQLFVNEFNLEMDKAMEGVKPVINSLTTDAAAKLNQWQSEYVCSVTTEMLHLKRTAKAISDEYSSYLQNKFNTYSIQWTKETLLPKLNESIQSVAKKLESRATELSSVITDIKVDLNFRHSSETEKLSSDATKVASVVYALFTGDILTALVGGVLGKEAMFRTLGLQLATGIALGIAACFTPIGLGAIVVGTLLSTIVGIGWTLSKLQNTITSKVTKEYRSMLSDSARTAELNDKIFSQIKLKLKDLKETVNDSAFADIKQIEADIQNILAEKRKGEEEVARRKASLEKAAIDIADIASSVRVILTNARA